MGSTEGSTLAGEFGEVSIELIDPNPWNPNVMSNDDFGRLVEEIDATGFIDPIQIVPMASGRFRVIGGEHRLEAMRSLGYESIPCIKLTDDKWSDDDYQRFVTTRLNLIRGKISSEKFAKMFADLSKRYEADSLQSLMGFVDGAQWKRVTKGLIDDLKGAGIPKGIVKRINKASGNVKTIDGLSKILQAIFSRYGSTVQQNFMVFEFGGEEHFMVKCDQELWDIIDEMSTELGDSGVDAQDIFKLILSDWRSHLPSD